VIRNTRGEIVDLLPKSETSERLGRIQAWMQQDEVDAVFVLQNADLFYFAGTIQTGLLCLPASGDPVYLVQKSLTRAHLESPLERLISMASFKRAPDILAGEGCTSLKRIGFEMDVLPVNNCMRFRDLFSSSEFVDASQAIRKIRMTKSTYEADQIRGAAHMLRLGFGEIPRWLKPGVTEIEVLARLEEFLRLHGHQGLVRMRGFNNEMAYGTISSGPSAAHPTYFPGPVGFVGLYPAIPGGGGSRRMEAGDAVMADIVGGYGGYIADKTRTFALGDVAKELETAHAFTLELMAGIESMLKPGVSCDRIYRSVTERVQSSPYASGFMGSGDSQVRFVGHGVGLELDELPVLAAGVDIPLEPGMIIAIEPKIFFPGKGGVGIENTCLITETGFENLTEFPEELIRVAP
jgi:Xaa-Pro aminopeptidase